MQWIFSPGRLPGPGPLACTSNFKLCSSTSSLALHRSSTAHPLRALRPSLRPFGPWLWPLQGSSTWERQPAQPRGQPACLSSSTPGTVCRELIPATAVAHRLPPHPSSPRWGNRSPGGGATIQLSWPTCTAPHSSRTGRPLSPLPWARGSLLCRPGSAPPPLPTGGAGTRLSRRSSLTAGQSTAGAAGFPSPKRLQICQAGRGAPLARIRHVRHHSHAPNVM
ncbi:hypothetical protein NDU88_004894 [Pleurodeles waltl]|uniref:Uncharacterized protein n=1 Tax=Pleurodeles waltl TaxID=8319 RepID=A0AAV7T977_PLEWA|nr:hypothetical protein NDU88_004894 [Pleurodeles waltl]